MKHFEYCPDCKKMLSALTLLDRVTKQKQYYCSKCLTLWLKTKQGLIIKSSLLEPLDKEFESHIPGMIEKDYEI